MGPRLFSRGKETLAENARDCDRLQWGRDCSAAERQSSAAVHCGQESASMGPRLFSRGKVLQRNDSHFPLQASMGPRLFSRGKRPARPESPSVRPASMGPRLFSRGKNMPSLKLNTMSRLQWGRDCSAAERPRTFSANRSSQSASMGPRLFSRGKAARMSRSAYKNSRFNGAATVQPRKEHQRRTERRQGTGFNGAATVQPRKGARAVAAIRSRRRFNGAATVQPRKACLLNSFRQHDSGVILRAVAGLSTGRTMRTDIRFR